MAHDAGTAVTCDMEIYDGPWSGPRPGGLALRLRAKGQLGN
jgi:hypothetical protein